MASVTSFLLKCLLSPCVTCRTFLSLRMRREQYPLQQKTLQTKWRRISNINYLLFRQSSLKYKQVFSQLTNSMLLWNVKYTHYAIDRTLGLFNTVCILIISFSMIHLHILGPTLPVPLFIWFPSVNSHESPSLHTCTPHASLLKHPHNTNNMV